MRVSCVYSKELHNVTSVSQLQLDTATDDLAADIEQTEKLPFLPGKHFHSFYAFTLFYILK